MSISCVFPAFLASSAVRNHDRALESSCCWLVAGDILLGSKRNSDMLCAFFKIGLDYLLPRGYGLCPD